MPTERRERERHEMRERIIDAARRLFVSEGYGHTTIRRIAEEIEYTPGAIYAYFKDKDAILYALHVQGFEELQRRMIGAVHGATDPLDQLGRIGRAYLEFARANPELYDLMFIAQSTSRGMQEGTWPEGHRTYDVLRQIVQAGLDGGWLRGDSAETVSFLLWSAVHGMASLEIRDRCVVLAEACRDTVHEDAYALMLQMLALPRTSPGHVEVAAAAAEMDPSPPDGPDRPRRRRAAPEM